MADLENLERYAIRSDDGRSDPLVTWIDRQPTWPDGVRRLLVGDELAHPVERDPRLLAAREHPPDHPRQETQPAEVRGEQRERSEIERSGRDRTGADQQHEAQTDVRSTLAERHHTLFEDAVTDRGVTPVLDEHTQAAQHRFGGVVDLDGRRRGHHVAEQPGDALGRGAVGRPVLLDPRVEDPRRDADAEQRDDQHRCRSGVGGAQHEARDHREHDATGDVDHTVDEIGDILGVVAEVCHR